MPIQPVSQSFSMQPASAIATKTFTSRPGDTLSQASSSESGDGFIMSILKPIGRFLAGLIRSIFCCCSYSPGLPKFTAEELNDWLYGEYEVVQKSATSFELTRKGITFTLEMVPYEGSFAVKLKGGEAFWGKDWFEKFHGSSTLLLDGISNEAATAVVGAVKKSDGLWVFKAPVENVLVVKGGDNIIQLLLPSGSEFIPIQLEDTKLDGCWFINDLEKHPELLPQIMEWAKATQCFEEKSRESAQLVAKAEPGSSLTKALLAAGFEKDDGVHALGLPDLAEALRAAGFEKDDGVYALELPKLEKK